jgi:hypothetical protein
MPAETRERQAIRILQAALPASTREARGLPPGGWIAQVATGTMTVTLPMNADTDIDIDLRSARSMLVRGVKQEFDADGALQHLIVMGTLPLGPDQTEVPMLVGDIKRADVVAWDGVTEQLGIWKMTVPR